MDGWKEKDGGIDVMYHMRCERTHLEDPGVWGERGGEGPEASLVAVHLHPLRTGLSAAPTHLWTFLHRLHPQPLP